MTVVMLSMGNFVAVQGILVGNSREIITKTKTRIRISIRINRIETTRIISKIKIIKGSNKIKNKAGDNTLLVLNVVKRDIWKTVLAQELKEIDDQKDLFKRFK